MSLYSPRESEIEPKSWIISLDLKIFFWLSFKNDDEGLSLSSIYDIEKFDFEITTFLKPVLEVKKYGPWLPSLPLISNLLYLPFDWPIIVFTLVFLLLKLFLIPTIFLLLLLYLPELFLTVISPAVSSFIGCEIFI